VVEQNIDMEKLFEIAGVWNRHAEK
jgi:hypothetical protein